MKRSTYLIAALSTLLAAGILLVTGLSRQNPQSAQAQTNTPASRAAPAPATLTAAPATTNTPASQAQIENQKSKIENPATLASTIPTDPLPLEPGTHDPAMIKQGDYYYLFYTGGLINQMRSKDLLHWERLPRLFPGIPTWMATALPNNRGDLWAPDIAFNKSKYFLYYAASSFGSNTSGIGLATTKSLDPASPDNKWQDDGLVIASKSTDFYNCIDPNMFLDSDGTAWLVFGSFYWNQGGGRGATPANPAAATKGGIQLVQLNPATGLLLPDAKPQPIASRAYPERAIEAPFLIRNDKWYYLFVSWDVCCRGLNSTYRIMVGRAEKITGPYLDKTGADMLKGGGTQILAGDGKRLIGPGGQSLLKDADRWLLIYHFYDGNTNGTSRLQIRPLSFDDKAWPVLNKPLNSPN